MKIRTAPFALLSLALILGAAPTWAVEKVTENTRRLSEGESPPQATLAAAAFIVGDWTAEAMGGVADEVWTVARAGAMMGAFRLVRDDVPVFYEFLTLREEAGSLILQLKHFDGKTLEGWEEKDKTVDFKLVGVEKGVLYLRGLTFRHTGPDALTVYLALRSKKGEYHEEVFRFRRR